MNGTFNPDSATVYYDAEKFYKNAETLSVLNRWIESITASMLAGKETPPTPFKMLPLAALSEATQKGLVCYR